MDPAVALTQAYLQANGFFTITEYPVIEALKDGGFRNVTDIDILALRMPGSGMVISRAESGGGHAGGAMREFEPDPALGLDDSKFTFIIGEIKQGDAVLNRGARSPEAISIALRRFALLHPDQCGEVTNELRRKGISKCRENGIARMFSFGSRPPEVPARGYSVMLYRPMVQYLMSVQRDLESEMLTAQLKQPALAMLMLLLKSGIKVEV